MSKLLVDEISDADNTGPVTVTDGAVVNRTGDGTIIDLQYGGTTVGSIGAANGNLYLGQGDTTIMFSASADAVLPKGTDGADRDGFINLGQNINRFKDLYLSGGVYLGGTGSANYLSDYEEGTWTPAFVSGQEPDGTVSSLAGQYVKVGKLVTVYMQVDGSSLNLTDYVRVEGLPFAASASNATGTYLLGGITDRNHGWTVLASGTTQWYWSTSGSDSETSIVASVTYRTA
jgi:hypothetical protein